MDLKDERLSPCAGVEDLPINRFATGHTKDILNMMQKPSISRPKEAED